MDKNSYKYSIKGGHVKGFFNIYQARSGKIMLQMNNSFTELTEKQINDLAVDVYYLNDFDYDDYKKAYNTN